MTEVAEILTSDIIIIIKAICNAQDPLKKATNALDSCRLTVDSDLNCHYCCKVAFLY